MKDFQEKIERYMDARMPMLYIDTFEDDIATAEIKHIAQRKRRGILEWSMQGFFFEENEMTNSILNNLFMTPCVT